MFLYQAFGEMNVMSCFQILAVKPLRVAVILAEDSLSYFTMPVWSRGFHLPPTALINYSSSDVIWAKCSRLLQVCSTCDSLKKKHHHRSKFKPRFSLCNSDEFNPKSPSHQEFSCLVFVVLANEYCVYEGRVKSTCIIYFNIYTDDHRSN